MFGYKDSGNWNSKPGTTSLSFSGCVKQYFHTTTFNRESKSDLKSTLSNPRSFKLQTSIEEKPSGERDPWLHENRSGREGAENSGGESRAEHSRGERVNFSEIMGVWLQG